jgi:poly(3-hydroxybutyrate) depolymerase
MEEHMASGRTHRLALGLFALAALGTAACEPAAPGGACIDNTAPGVRTFPASRCGLDFTVSIPATCPAGGCGLIFDVHGFAMDGNIQDRNTNLRRLGNQAGFIVAQPTAPVAGQGLPSFSTQRDANTIAAFAIGALGPLRVNRNRIHIGGFSQGGAITFFSICNHADLYASAAPIAAAGGNGCFQNGPPIPFLQTNGTMDQFANFQAASTTRSQVIAGMGLTAASGTPLQSFPGISQTRFQNARGQIYEFIEHTFIGASAGAGHCFPGSFETTLAMVGPGLGTLRFACTDQQQLRIGEAIVQFYQANPKR